MNPIIPPAMCYVAPQQFFYKDGFGIKQPKKIDMPFNKETKPNLKRFSGW